MWKVKYNTNEPIYETDIGKRCVVAKGAGLQRGKFWEFGISGCKVLYMEWINNKVLYHTGIYIQYPVINHNGNECEICVCRPETLCYAAETNTTV